MFETSLLVNNNLCGKLVLSLELPIKFNERFNSYISSVFIADLNLLGGELDIFTFNVLYWVILY